MVSSETVIKYLKLNEKEIKTPLRVSKSNFSLKSDFKTKHVRKYSGLPILIPVLTGLKIC